MKKSLLPKLVFALLLVVAIIWGSIQFGVSAVRSIPLETDQSIDLFSLENSDITPTGLCYDSQNNTFWISDLGTSTPDIPIHTARLLEVNSDFSQIIASINITDLIDGSGVQGLTYDSKQDTLWFANSQKVFQMSKEGEVLGTLDLQGYEQYLPNGICYDSRTDSLWVLFYYQYLINFKKDGKILQLYDCNLADQDHLFLYNDQLYISAGADYDGTENYLYLLNEKTGRVSPCYQLMNSHAIEGFVILDDILYITNDGKFHSDIIGKNYISIYSLSTNE